MINFTWKRCFIFTIVISILSTILYVVIRCNNGLSIRSWRNIFDVVRAPDDAVSTMSGKSVRINSDGTVTVNCSAIHKEDALLDNGNAGHASIARNCLAVKDVRVPYKLMLMYIMLQDISNKIESGGDFASDLEMVKMLSSSVPNLQLLLSRISISKVKTKHDIEARFIILKSKIDWCIHSIKYKNELLANVTFWLKKLFSISNADEMHGELSYDNIAKGVSDLNCKDDKISQLKHDVSDIIATNLVINEMKQLISALLLHEYNAPSTNE